MVLVLGNQFGALDSRIGAGSSIAEEGKKAVHADTDKAEAGSLDWSPDTQLLWNWLSS